MEKEIYKMVKLIFERFDLDLKKVKECELLFVGVVVIVRFG